MNCLRLMSPSGVSSSHSPPHKVRQVRVRQQEGWRDSLLPARDAFRVVNLILNFVAPTWDIRKPVLKHVRRAPLNARRPFPRPPFILPTLIRFSVVRADLSPRPLVHKELTSRDCRPRTRPLRQIRVLVQLQGLSPAAQTPTHRADLFCDGPRRLVQLL